MPDQKSPPAGTVTESVANTCRYLFTSWALWSLIIPRFLQYVATLGCFEASTQAYTLCQGG